MGDRDAAAAYARFYAPLAVVSVVISFLPILEDDYGTLWQMAGRPGGGPAVLGVMLMGLLIACLAAAAFRPARTTALPAVIAVAAALIIVMLLTKPGTGDPTPGLAPAGEAAVAVAVCTLVLSVSHALHVRSSA